MQLVNCRTDRCYGLLSKSLRLLTSAVLLALSEVSVTYIESAGAAQGWKSGDVSFARGLLHDLG